MPRNDSRPTLLLLHGRGGKPPQDELEELWFEALLWNLPKETAEAVNRCRRRLLYYGDLSNQFLGVTENDIEVRRSVLAQLKQSDFERYAGPSSYTIEVPPPDIEAYWDRSDPFSISLQQRLLDELKTHTSSEGEVILLAHSLGGVLAYDALTLHPELGERLTLITLGSPHWLPHFRTHLLQGERRLAGWFNIAARGDHACGPPMAEAQQIDVLNPALRDGVPDPHHALGYLSHPETGKLLGRLLLR